MFWNSSYNNRIGFGKDTGDRGCNADNFKLNGYGKMYGKSND